eukprot:1607806-Pleurochrysis_carterae.AAC.9
MMGNSNATTRQMFQEPRRWQKKLYIPHRHCSALIDKHALWGSTSSSPHSGLDAILEWIDMETVILAPGFPCPPS